MNSPDDKDVDDLLAGQSDLSRRYRASVASGSDEEPPADLDRAILAKARAAVQSTQGNVAPLPVRSRAKWAVPFALAASVLLTVVVVREGNQKVGVNGEVITGVLTEQSVAPSSASAVADTALAPASDERAEAVFAARDEGTQRSAQSQSVAPVVALSPPEALTRVPAPEVTITTAGPVVTQELTATSGLVPPPPAAPPPVRAAAAARAPAVQQASADAARPESEAAKSQRTPETWLEDVRKLRAAGEGVAADLELQRFLEAYPDYFTRNPDIARP